MITDFNRTGLRRLVAALFIGLLVLAAPAMALDLQEAKQKGLVGETTSGYLAAVGAGTPEVESLVDEINRKRRAEYERIARENDIALGDVEALAGKRAIEESPKGHYVRPNGDWVRK